MSSPPQRLDYLSSTQRPKLTWPNGARIAVWVVAKGVLTAMAVSIALTALLRGGQPRERVAPRLT